MKKTLITSAIILLMIAGGALYYFSGKEYVLRFSENQIREKLNARLPLTKTYLMFFDVTLDNPRVNLENGSERVVAGLDIALNIRIGKEEVILGGVLDASGWVIYVPEIGAFFLTEPEIERLSVQGIPEKYTEKVNSVLTRAIEEFYADHPIYTLKTTDVKQAAARIVLKEVMIENKELVVVLGI